MKCRKHHQSDLLAQGYPPIYKFMKREEGQKNEKKLTGPQDLTPEELEESSADDTAAASRLWGNVPPSTSSNGTDIDEAGSEEHRQDMQGHAACEGHHQATRGPAASEGHHQFMQGPAASEKHPNSATNEGCHHVAQGPAVGDGNHRAAWALSDEEGSTGNENEDWGSAREDRQNAGRKNGKDSQGLRYSRLFGTGC